MLTFATRQACRSHFAYLHLIVVMWLQHASDMPLSDDILAEPGLCCPWTSTCQFLQMLQQLYYLEYFANRGKMLCFELLVDPKLDT